ncbi:MAG: Na+/H+ antiporter NhaC family protein, partial [Clostridia bacterium]|nr:Na+/H+ antiporter NhaC family protein [Clostridia bacterium]
MKLFSKRSLILFAITLMVMCVMTVVVSAQGTQDGAGEPTAIKCSNEECGAVIAQGDHFCATCGTEFECPNDHESLTVDFCAYCGEELNPTMPKLYSTFWALIPPLVAIVLALITKEVYSSLFVGILLGGLLAADFKPVQAFDNVLNHGIIAAVSGTAGIFIFLVVLGTLVALINKAGGSAAFGRWAETHIKSKVGASLATFVLGVLIFIDDYFNCLTVGSVMVPVTDRH